ncbi:MAG: hypothetical protein AABP62_02905 [Planctomycetota bacterium]
MNSYSSMAEWFLLFPLWLLRFVTGWPNVAGPAVLVAVLTVAGLWGAVFNRWIRDDRPVRLVGIFLVAFVCFPPAAFLIMVQAFGASPNFPLVNQFLAVAQSYLSLSVLTLCEAYWQHRGRAAYITAALTTLIGLLVWMITGFCYALTLQ